MRQHRRDFLKLCSAGAAGVLLADGRGTAQAARRQVSIGGRRVRVIDGHAHCVIPVQHITKGTPLEKMGGGAGNSLLGPQRLQIMDQQGVDVQALTINNFWWYAAAADLARRICLAQNGASRRGSRSIPIGSSRPQPWHCSIPSSPPSSCRTA